MPISAEQWRVKTGMINASRGFRQHSIKPPSLCEFPLTPPPSDWKGYNLVLTLLCLPLLYKTYTLGATVIMYLVRGEIYKHDSELVSRPHESYDDILNQQHGSILGLLLSGAFYLVMMMMALAMSVCEYRERDKHQWRLIQPLHQLKFIWFDVVATGREGSLQVVPKMVTRCVYAAFVMERENTLECVRKYSSTKTVMKKTSGHISFISFILQLSTIALAILLLQAGDVERNPGPLLSEEHIRTLVNELKPAVSKYHELGLQLGVKAARIEVIEQDHSFTERRLTEVLLFWLRGNTDVPTCWESIIDALKHVDRRQLAEELMKKYCVCKTELATPTLLQEYGGKIPLPVLDTSLLDDTEKQRCQKLSADIEKLSQRFQDLFDSISTSLEERKIPISKIVAKIRTFQAFEPVYGSVEDSRPILEHRMAELRNAKSIDDVMFIIGAYSSFFNYHLVERIIKSLGTDEDKELLAVYEEKYRCFAECMVFECPTKFKETADHHTRKFMVKVDDSFEKCTLSHLNRFINKLSEVLKLSEGTLLLESIRRGCLELTLQSPLFVYESIFPLSSDQESALAALGVIKISAGDYQYPHHSQDESDTDDNDDKPDDGSGPGGGHGDSGIDTLTTVLSELSELSEEAASICTAYSDIEHDSKQKSKTKTAHNQKVNQGLTPLHIAAYWGRLDYVKVLVNSKKFKPSQRDHEGNTALHHAIKGRQLDVVKYFIEEHEYNPSDFEQHGETPLHLACRCGDFKIVKYLVEDQQVDPVCEDKKYGATPLYAACIGCNIDIVRYLVKEMTTFVTIKDISEDRTKQGNGYIHYAAEGGSLAILKYFLYEIKCDPNIRGQDGRTPLHRAAIRGNIDVVKYLVNVVHCDLSVVDDSKRTPFFVAVESKSLETVKFLGKQKKGSNPMCRDINGMTPLHLSAFIGEVGIVNYFISELKCDPNAKNKHGLTPLQMAAIAGHDQVVEYLKKCVPSIKSSSSSAAHGAKHHGTWSSNMGRPDILYRKHPAKAISTTLREGEDPLHNIDYFPPFKNLPEEREFKQYYKQRDKVNWIFMAEITNDDNSQKSGFGYHNHTLVCDRSGKDNIPIYFHPIEGEFNFSTLKKGHTLFVQQATKHHFQDGTVGLHIEIPSTLLVVPCSMKDLFALSELYYKCKDVKCWTCGKTQAVDTTTSPSQSATGTTGDHISLKKCGACKVARYCSKECQTTDWKKCHRRLCKVMPHFIKLTEL